MGAYGKVSADGFQPFVHAGETQTASLGCGEIEADAKIVDRQLDVIGSAAKRHGDPAAATVLDGVLQRLLQDTIQTQHDAL